MKAILITCCAFMLAITGYAQTPDKTLVKVLYHFGHITDTTKRDKPYTENMLLIAGKNASAYLSYDKINQRVNTDVNRQELQKKGFSNQEMNDIARANNAANKPTSATQYYFFNKENKFYSMEPLFNGYLVDDEIEKIDWKITKDTSSILGLHCQKGTAHYKGRNWIAWFAEELPFEAGPWKLHGLPGLIVEAYDDRKDVQFMFAGVEKVKNGDLAIEDAHKLTPDNLNRLMSYTAGLDISQVMLPRERPVHEGGYEKATKKEYDRLKAESDKDPIAFRNAELNANGMGQLIAIMAANPGSSGGGGSTDANGNLKAPPIATKTPAAPQPAKDAINNPIELPEKK